jgi:hypothetical protein
MTRKTIGQALSKDGRWIYTWYDDGTVDRHRANGTGEIEKIDPPASYNAGNFHAFIQVAKPEANPIDTQRGAC